VVACSTEIRLQDLPRVGSIAERSEESRFEPTDRVRRRKQTPTQLFGLDFRSAGIRQKPPPILPSSSAWLFSNV
jgi:hypothetical protein